MSEKKSKRIEAGNPESQKAYDEMQEMFEKVGPEYEPEELRISINNIKIHGMIKANDLITNRGYFENGDWIKFTTSGYEVEAIVFRVKKVGLECSE